MDEEELTRQERIEAWITLGVILSFIVVAIILAATLE